MDAKMIRLAVIDDDAKMVELISQYIQKDENFELAGKAHSAETGLTLLETTAVDVLLFDLVMPNYDGFYLLEELNRTVVDIPVYIMMSGLNSSHIISLASEFNVDHFAVKPFDIDLLFKRILSIYRHRNLSFPNKSVLAFSPDEYICKILDNMYLSKALTGYKCIVTAVQLALKDPTMLDDVTKRLYPNVAKEHKSTSQRVERAMRHAIQTIWQKEDVPRKFAKTMNFPFVDKKPTNSHFIASIVGKHQHVYSKNKEL